MEFPQEHTMTSTSFAKNAFIFALATLICTGVAVAQANNAAPDNKPPDIIENMKFRNLGPAAGGGRVAAVSGIPGNANVYYVGAAAGGVWKTTDAGLTWKAIFEKQPTASIGAIALAPSNPNLLWVGTGEGNPRNDVIDGRGVFFSPDAGKSWKPMGLRDVGQITRIVIDPANPDVVFVAALGHAWGPNSERGIYRSTNGGQSWDLVLHKGPHAGAADLALDF